MECTNHKNRNLENVKVLGVAFIVHFSLLFFLQNKLNIAMLEMTLCCLEAHNSGLILTLIFWLTMPLVFSM